MVRVPWTTKGPEPEVAFSLLKHTQPDAWLGEGVLAKWLVHQVLVIN